MKKFSTPNSLEMSESDRTTTSTMTKQLTQDETDRETVPAPRKSTIEFLRQFARAYSSEPHISIAELRGAVMN